MGRNNCEPCSAPMPPSLRDVLTGVIGVSETSLRLAESIQEKLGMLNFSEKPGLEEDVTTMSTQIGRLANNVAKITDLLRAISDFI